MINQVDGDEYEDFVDERVEEIDRRYHEEDFDIDYEKEDVKSNVDIDEDLNDDGDAEFEDFIEELPDMSNEDDHLPEED